MMKLKFRGIFMENETFLSLLTNKAHWEFELFLMFIFDVLIGFILFPFLKKWILHHKTDDEKIADLQQKISKIEEKINKS